MNQAMAEWSIERKWQSDYAMMQYEGLLVTAFMYGRQWYEGKRKDLGSVLYS